MSNQPCCPPANPPSVCTHSWSTVAATCTVGGYERCTRCSATRNCTSARGHNWSIVAATCTAGGYEICTRCSATRNCTSARGHNWSIVAATCTAGGYEICTRCSVTRNCTPVREHNWTITKKETCNAEGSRRCLNCNKTESIKAHGQHKWVTTKQATCIAIGSRECSLCGTKQNISTTCHSFNTSGVCKTCGYSNNPYARIEMRNTLELKVEERYSFNVTAITLPGFNRIQLNSTELNWQVISGNSVTVNNSGRVTAVREGNSIISASNGVNTAQCSIRVRSYELSFYSAFLVGKGPLFSNRDYDTFRTNFKRDFRGASLNNSSEAENINQIFRFTDENMRSILESDIAYISSHGFLGGVIPIYESKNNINFTDYNQIISTFKGITNNQFTYSKPIFQDFSINMKDHIGEGINERLKWIITAACSQLDHTDKEYNSVERWVDVLVKNKKLRGILGYQYFSPGATHEDIKCYEVIEKFLLHSSTNGQFLDIYGAWDIANVFNWFTNLLPGGSGKANSALLVKSGYEFDRLKPSLYDDTDAVYNRILHYRKTNDWYVVHQNILPVAQNSINTFALNNNIQINLEKCNICATLRDEYNEEGELLSNDILCDFQFVCKLDNENECQCCVLKYDVEKECVKLLGILTE